MTKIKEIYLNNFKSFKDCRVKLDDFNIIIAPNNAGKSNFILALEFINLAIRKGFDRAINEFGGLETLKNYRNPNENITIGIKSEKNTLTVFSRRISRNKRRISHNKYDEHIINFKDISNETTFVFNEKIEKIEINIEGKYRIENLEGFNGYDDKQIVEEVNKKRHKKFSIKISINQTINIEENIPKKSKNQIFEFLGLSKLREFFKRDLVIENKDISDLLGFSFPLITIGIGIFTYYFSAHKIKETSEHKSGNILNKSGTNLASVLEHIKNENPDIFEEISTSLIGIVEEIEGIDISKDILGRPELVFQERLSDNTKEIPIDIISDGTINLISTLTALYEYIPKTLIAIEEPERHLHLRAISYLIEEFRNVSSEKQIIITTQSSEILNNLDLKKDNLIFLFRDYDGNTKSITHKDIPRFKEKLRIYKNDISLLLKKEGLGYLGDYLE